MLGLPWLCCTSQMFAEAHADELYTLEDASLPEYVNRWVRLPNVTALGATPHQYIFSFYIIVKPTNTSRKKICY